MRRIRGVAIFQSRTRAYPSSDFSQCVGYEGLQSFNPALGLIHLLTQIRVSLPPHSRPFNPALGLIHLLTPVCQVLQWHLHSFNPALGLIHLLTVTYSRLCRRRQDLSIPHSGLSI